MEHTVATRLKLFMENQGLTHSQFADTSSIPRPTLSQLLSGRNKKISDVLVGQIHKAYPRLSVLWLLFGEGEMLLPTADGVAGVADSIADDSIFAPDSTVENTDGQETALELAQNHGQMPIAKGVKYSQKSVDFQCQINEIAKNPRKVIQITVYYDDSTFETFYPERNK